MARSVSVSSDSSHESESPRKRAPSEDPGQGSAASSIENRPLGDGGGCIHVKLLLTKPDLLVQYQKAVQWGINSRSFDGPPRKRRKTQPPSCGECQLAQHRPLMCLSCRYIGCWRQSHITAHLTKQSHDFAVDMVSGALYCGTCEDFQVSDSLDMIYSAQKRYIEEEALPSSGKKRKREPYKPWNPTAKESDSLAKMTILPCAGRRGLLNLGATCYLNVILQCVLHNPLLRNFFLSDKHNARLCNKANCMCCELDKLFTEVYSMPSASQVSTTPPSSQSSSVTAAPLGPISLLKTTWENSADLAGYAQQDAHEFFIALLNQVHMSCDGSTNSTLCSCISHQAFAGQLQSDVKCGKCGSVNPTIDPMMDISLELKGLQGGEPKTLASCLRRFTQAEKLPPKSYICGYCKVPSEATKRLSIKTLPPVLCIQLKRFEHKSSASKIDIPVRFPLKINMAPYTTQSIGMGAKDGKSAGLSSKYEYDLFAVVNHEGQLNTGHYTNYARCQNEWYRFDDDKVTHATSQDCLKSVPYMCFYVKRNLEYAAPEIGK